MKKINKHTNTQKVTKRPHGVTLCWSATPRHETYAAVCHILTDTQLKKNDFPFFFSIS